MSTVAIIPAKGFSRRIPRKNVKPFFGKPILAYSIKAARDTRLFDSIVVSTDDEEISEIAQNYGADVMRRGEKWAGDEIGPLDVARHTISLMADVSLVCVIYATAPLMAISDVVKGFHCVSRPTCYYAFSAASTPFLHDAGQFFWAHAWALRERLPEFGDNTVLVPISPERDCDINEPSDWVRAELLYAALHRKAA